MCSLLWPGHFNFFYSCVGYWTLLNWFGDPLSCQASGNDQWKVCIYYIFSRSQFCQEGNSSWTHICLVFELFEWQVQVGNLCPGGWGEGRVLWISSDEDARMWAKIKIQKNSLEFQQNPRILGGGDGVRDMALPLMELSSLKGHTLILRPLLPKQCQMHWNTHLFRGVL